MSSSALKSLKKEITEYNKRILGKVPKEITDASEILDKYQIYDKEVIKRLSSASKSEQKRIASEYGVTETDMDALTILMAKIEKAGATRLIPAMMSKAEREEFESGKKAADDI